MDWYRVQKRIRGGSYDYWQKTYRVGRSVKTLNKYIGPSGHARQITMTAPVSNNHARPEKIVRMNDLSPQKQKEYMKESMRRIKADKQKANPSERAVMYFCRKCDHMTFSTGWEGHCRCGNTTYYVKK